MEDIVGKLLRGCKPGEVEVEARIRRQLVSRHSALQLIFLHGPNWHVSQYLEKKKISKNNRKCTYRSRIGPNEHICKSFIAREDANDMWCTIHVSVETPMPSMQRSLDGVPSVEVVRHRTVVDNHYVDVIDGRDEMRVEVEACDARMFSLEAMLGVVKYVCTLLQGNKEFLGYYDWKTVMHVSGTLFGPFCIDKKHYQKPRTLTIDVLGNIARNMSHWAVTPKVDGVRRFVVIANAEVYSLGTAKEVAHLKITPLTDGEDCTGMNGSNAVTILDCELANNILYAFDIPVHDGVYCGNRSFDERTHIMDRVVDELAGSGIDILVKPYETFSSFDKLKRLYEQFSDDEFEIDGMIFCNVQEGYMQPVPKWKMYSTVDLEVKRGSLVTCDGYVVNMQHTHLPDDAFGIWEFSYADDTLDAKRSRPDKLQANSMGIVEKNMFGSVPGTLFTGHGFYLMRKYHNRVKNALIREAGDFKATLLDIGTGQGGDVTKWSRVSRIFCVEPTEDCGREVQRRQKKAGIKTKITFIEYRLEDIDTDYIDEKVDIITAFFCMNQWSSNDWRMLKDVVTQKGSKRCRLLAIAMTGPKKHKSSNLQIVMRKDDKYNVKMFGTRIMDIDETIVIPSKLTKLMKECGMKLIKEERLDVNDFMTSDERRLSSMYTMFKYQKV